MRKNNLFNSIFLQWSNKMVFNFTVITDYYKRILLFILLVPNNGLSFNLSENNIFIMANDTIFYEGFENGFAGWNLVNHSDPGSPTIWRTTNTRFVSGNHSAAWNDSVTNSYPHNLHQAIDSPPVTLPLNARIFINFKVFIHLTPNGNYANDYFHVKYTTNSGTTWNNFLNYARSGQHPGWLSFPEDFQPINSPEITHLAGKTVQFRFIAYSDNNDPNGYGIFLDDINIYSQECDFIDPNEPNNSIANATLVELPATISASLCPQNDEDFYKFNLQTGDKIVIVTEHSASWTYLYFYNPNGFTILYAYNEFEYTATTSGTYTVRVTGPWGYSLNYNIYFNSLVPEPNIISVTDIPDDQGMQVRVKWLASFYDPQNLSGQIKEYQLWRKVSDSLQVTKESVFTNNELYSLESLNKNNKIYFSINNEYWDYITTVPAISGRPFLNYSFVAPTLADNMLTTFMVGAVPKNSSDPILWGTEGSGMSEDNLSPGFNNVLIYQTAGGNNIKWEVNDPDVVEFEIYKGIHQLFEPVLETRIASQGAGSIEYLDTELLNGFIYFYIITAKDKSGNVAYSPTISSGVSNLENEIIIPADFSLKQNFPNPFNPLTTIEFYIPSVSNISLRINDVIGREIMELVKGNFTPGIHKIEFNAKNLTSGIYFYTLTASGGNVNFKETKKLILLK